MNVEKLLHDIYYNKHNYDGINQLWSKAKATNPSIKRDEVKKWLDKQNVYQQTAPTVGKKEYLPIYSESPYSFQIDLTFFPRYASRNDGYTVLYTAININTRFAFAYKAKTKDMKTITGFLKDMEKKTVISTITCDEGSEFNNKEFKKFCNDENIILYFVKNDSNKLGIINRFHRTLKEKLSKYFIASNGVRWIDVIDDVVRNYNHSVNRGIGLAPASVKNGQEVDIIDQKRAISQEIRQKRPEIIEIGDYVRLMNNKTKYEDKLKPKYGEQVLKVVKAFKNAVDVKTSDGVERKKISQVRKVIQSGEVIPSSQTDQAGKESKVTRIMRREGLDAGNILTARRRL
jgi:hypothetical protein